MKFVHVIIALLLMFLAAVPMAPLWSVYIKNEPYKIVQPNGSEIDCFVSGDEYYNWIHDDRGFTTNTGLNS